MKINLPSGKDLTVTSQRGNKESPWSPSGDNYKVKVSYNGKRFSFDFWDSFASMKEGKDCDLRGAVACWASDVFSALSCSSADDVASQFGYEKPSEALRVFKGIKRAEKQYDRIGMMEEDLQFLAEY